MESAHGPASLPSPQELTLSPASEPANIKNVLLSTRATSSSITSNSTPKTQTGTRTPVKSSSGKSLSFAPISQLQLYNQPTNRLSLRFSSLWNGTVAIYNPYLNLVTKVLSFPGVSQTGTYHIGGVAWDPLSGLYTILTDPAAAWATEGGDLSGDHLVIKYNPFTSKTLWTANLTTISHERYGGFQDVETDRRGNTYVVGTFPGTILRVDKTGKEIKEWYLPDPFPAIVPGRPFTRRGFGGLAAVPGTEWLLSNDGDGRIYRFDMRAAKGKPVAVPIEPEVLYNDTDAIYLPPKYGGKVLLVASWGSGVQVLRTSRGGSWKKAEYVGTVAVDFPRDEEFPAGGVPVAVTQIGPEALYVILGFGDFPWVEGTVAGGRRRFPMPDITRQVEELLRK